MKKLRNELDKKNKTNRIIFHSKFNKKNIKYCINKIDSNYNNLNNDPIINNFIYNLKNPELLINKEKIIINKEIHNLND